ncbi:MAG: hypothetical protein FJ096_18910 [Deltaproteobacteria bacterium]|nr:hypothetical protein [Deltaproteobacteria bacterium]
MRALRALLVPALTGLLACTKPAVVPPPPPPKPAPEPKPAVVVQEPPPKFSFTPEGGGQNFAEEAKLLYRIVACAGDAELTPEIATAIEEHCKELPPKIAEYKKSWLDVAMPFLATLVPANAPKKVVYPFAGGDNTTMFATYPNAEEYTTISLELSGEVRRVREVQAKTLPTTLRKLRARLDELYGPSKFSLSETLQKMMTGEIPQELSFLMVGLSLHNLEPVSLRYFKLEKDGRIHYFTEDELAQAKGSARRRSPTWQDGDFSEAYSNVEIGFKPRDANGPVRFHRHIAWNLDNPHLKLDPGLIEHLSAKGDVVAIVKAASYLLWKLDFSRFRDYLLTNSTMIVSDSTAPVPRDAAPRGYEQEVWGSFGGAPIPAVNASEKEMKKFWSSQPTRPLDFRFGYLDRHDKPHLMVSRRKP